MAEFYTDPNFWIAVTAVIGVIIAILKLNNLMNRMKNVEHNQTLKTS
jgi:hypothetical protein